MTTTKARQAPQAPPTIAPGCPSSDKAPKKALFAVRKVDERAVYGDTTRLLISSNSSAQPTTARRRPASSSLSAARSTRPASTPVERRETRNRPASAAEVAPVHPSRPQAPGSTTKPTSERAKSPTLFGRSKSISPARGSSARPTTAASPVPIADDAPDADHVASLVQRLDDARMRRLARRRRIDAVLATIQQVKATQEVIHARSRSQSRSRSRSRSPSRARSLSLSPIRHSAASPVRPPSAPAATAATSTRPVPRHHLPNPQSPQAKRLQSGAATHARRYDQPTAASRHRHRMPAALHAKPVPKRRAGPPSPVKPAVVVPLHRAPPPLQLESLAHLKSARTQAARAARVAIPTRIALPRQHAVVGHVDSAAEPSTERRAFRRAIEDALLDLYKELDEGGSVYGPVGTWDDDDDVANDFGGPDTSMAPGMEAAASLDQLTAWDAV
ncbi:hypothetical protein AMAG_08217 [Allomyces macrogynus ATCC 38327]|uniref:Uncharacterized protein n=1 Tax=Allomyces macrogynus (strain ATCC 38327) TaxID=578462 RepID=A0A0L0SKI6_ALLM3|nr:hypothetical protein AMAG_08217 [Allomyces macrogynus ATCC 38327]|eukprot:KNE63051.1 hypothetical protein AMAG_08217 [Allomyces macrogynus ATCC 38327]